MEKELLSRLVREYLQSTRECITGIATIETLAGGPPTADLEFVLKGAKSAVSFALPLDQDAIEPYLTKENRRNRDQDDFDKNAIAGGAALNLSKWLEQKGYPSVPIAANDYYRDDTPHGRYDMVPDISLRYIAARSGVGFFGLSGNILSPKYGAAILLGAVVTTAELIPTDPVPEKDQYCDNCKLCMATCLSGLMDHKEMASVTLGGKEFQYAKRKHYVRCQYVCGGFSGLHPSGKWSTWSPGRFEIPDTDKGYFRALKKTIGPYYSRPEMEGGYLHSLMDGKLHVTCGNCQLICHPDKAVRKERYKMLTQSNRVVIQKEDGQLEGVDPETAQKYIDGLPEEKKAWYV